MKTLDGKFNEIDIAFVRGLASLALLPYSGASAEAFAMMAEPDLDRPTGRPGNRSAARLPFPPKANTGQSAKSSD